MYKQKLYYLVKDNGDSSTNICFFKDPELVNKLLETDAFAINDQIHYMSIPNNVSLTDLGITISDHLYKNV